MSFNAEMQGFCLKGILISLEHGYIGLSRMSSSIKLEAAFRAVEIRWRDRAVQALVSAVRVRAQSCSAT